MATEAKPKVVAQIIPTAVSHLAFVPEELEKQVSLSMSLGIPSLARLIMDLRLGNLLLLGVRAIRLSRLRTRILKDAVDSIERSFSSVQSWTQFLEAAICCICNDARNISIQDLSDSLFFVLRHSLEVDDSGIESIAAKLEIPTDKVFELFRTLIMSRSLSEMPDVVAAFSKLCLLHQRTELLGSILSVGCLEIANDPTTLEELAGLQRAVDSLGQNRGLSTPLAQSLVETDELNLDSDENMTLEDSDVKLDLSFPSLKFLSDFLQKSIETNSFDSNLLPQDLEFRSFLCSLFDMLKTSSSSTKAAPRFSAAILHGLSKIYQVETFEAAIIRDFIGSENILSSLISFCLTNFKTNIPDAVLATFTHKLSTNAEDVQLDESLSGQVGLLLKSLLRGKGSKGIPEDSLLLAWIHFIDQEFNLCIQIACSCLVSLIEVSSTLSETQKLAVELIMRSSMKARRFDLYCLYAQLIPESTIKDSSSEFLQVLSLKGNFLSLDTIDCIWNFELLNVLSSCVRVGRALRFRCLEEMRHPRFFQLNSSPAIDPHCIARLLQRSI